MVVFPELSRPKISILIYFLGESLEKILAKKVPI
jgi:hypothetical protein